MFDSLRAALGPDGFKTLSEEMSRNYKARAQAAADAEASGGDDGGIQHLPPHLRAPFLGTLEDVYPGSDDGSAGVGEWGFIVYRIASFYTADESRWSLFWTRWQSIVDEKIRAYMDVPGVSAAAQRLRFPVITHNGRGGSAREEGRGDEDASLRAVAARYRTLLGTGRDGEETLPAGLGHRVCLAVNEASMRSVLEVADSAPGAQRKQVPFGVAVDQSLGLVEQPEEGSEGRHGPYAGYFNVAIRSLVDELFTVVGGQILEPFELGLGMGPRQVLCAPGGGRHGVVTLD